jgi:hypothetical protein
MTRFGHRLSADAPARRRRTAALLIMVAAMIAIAAALGPAGAEDKEISARRASEPKSFTDRQIIDGFFKIIFGAEYHTAGRIDRIRKFDGPIRVYIDNRAQPDRSGEFRDVIADIARRIAKLDIAVTDDRRSANVVVSLVRDRDLGRTISKLYGREHARRIESSLEPQCLTGFHKNENYRIEHAEVIVVADAGDFVFYDCAYEETLQALGPINDDGTVPWTMFNDDVQMGFFDLYDQYLLNLLYHERIRPGMTRAEVAAIIAEILPDVRAFVARTNGLGP